MKQGSNSKGLASKKKRMKKNNQDRITNFIQSSTPKNLVESLSVPFKLNNVLYSKRQLLFDMNALSLSRSSLAQIHSDLKQEIPSVNSTLAVLVPYSKIHNNSPFFAEKIKSNEEISNSSDVSAPFNRSKKVFIHVDIENMFNLDILPDFNVSSRRMHRSSSVEIQKNAKRLVQIATSSFEISTPRISLASSAKFNNSSFQLNHSQLFSRIDVNFVTIKINGCPWIKLKEPLSSLKSSLISDSTIPNFNISSNLLNINSKKSILMPTETSPKKVNKSIHVHFVPKKGEIIPEAAELFDFENAMKQYKQHVQEQKFMVLAQSSLKSSPTNQEKKKKSKIDNTIETPFINQEIPLDNIKPVKDKEVPSKKFKENTLNNSKTSVKRKSVGKSKSNDSLPLPNSKSKKIEIKPRSVYSPR